MTGQYIDIWMVFVEMEHEMNYNKKDAKILAGIWGKTSDASMKCPHCNGKMILMQTEPLQEVENAYVAYDTIIECTFCSFKIRTKSFTLLGGVKNFDLHDVEISSWSPSGSRVLSEYEHMLDYDLLKKLKESGELIEFLVVNDHVVQAIG